MPETPDDPLLPPTLGDPLDAPLPFAPGGDPLGPPVVSAPPVSTPVSPPVSTPAVPFETTTAPAPPPVSFAPEAVRQRSASDLPFAVSPGMFAGPAGQGVDEEGTEGIPTGLPDLRGLAGVEVEEPEPTPAVAPPAMADDLDGDGSMALPSPSMMEPSPYADEEWDDEGPDGEGADEVVLGHLEPGLHDDETQQEQLPPTPIGMVRRDPGDVVPARVLMDALQASERRHMVHLAVAFVLGAASSVLGFVAARWALANL